MKSVIEWYHVSDMLPEASMTVLACSEGCVIPAYHVNHGWYRIDCDYADAIRVTWWAYMPDSPKE
jgi:hypothetical protein